MREWGWSVNRTLSLSLFFHSMLQDSPSLPEQTNVPDTREELAALMRFPDAHDRANEHFVLSCNVFDCTVLESLRSCKSENVARYTGKTYPYSSLSRLPSPEGVLNNRGVMEFIRNPVLLTRGHMSDHSCDA